MEIMSLTERIICKRLIVAKIAQLIWKWKCVWISIFVETKTNERRRPVDTRMLIFCNKSHCLIEFSWEMFPALLSPSD